MDEKIKRKNWKGITSFLIWVGIMQMLTNGFPFYGFRIGLAISPFFANAFVNVAACFGLLCAVSAIRNERILGKIVGALRLCFGSSGLLNGLTFISAIMPGMFFVEIFT